MPYLFIICGTIATMGLMLLGGAFLPVGGVLFQTLVTAFAAAAGLALLSVSDLTAGDEG